MATLQTLENRTIEPIVAGNLVLAGEAVRRADGEYLIKSQRGFEDLFASQKEGWRLPTVQEYITIFKELEQTNGPALEGILQDLRENALCTATKIDYKTSNLPLGNGYLDELVKSPVWRKALEDELFQYDAPEAIDVLQRASGKRSYIWVSSAEGRRSNPERAVWVNTYAGRFDLVCIYGPINLTGRSRRVRVESAAGARENGGPYRKTAKTPEEVLDERIREILSPYEQLKSPATAELYEGITQNALGEFKELYHSK